MNWLNCPRLGLAALLVVTAVWGEITMAKTYWDAHSADDHEWAGSSLGGDRIRRGRPAAGPTGAWTVKDFAPASAAGSAGSSGRG